MSWVEEKLATRSEIRGGNSEWSMADLWPAFPRRRDNDIQRRPQVIKPFQTSVLSRRSFLQLPVGTAMLAGIGDLAIESAAGPSGFPISAEGQTRWERNNVPVTSWRTLESGFHNGPTTHFDQLDPEVYMAKAREAHTECVVIQTKSHWGYAYYNTKVGSRHPNLNYDLVARWLEAGHRNGLSVVAYYSGQVDTQSALKHPEWMGRNPDGSPSWLGRQFAWCCHHSGYREYALGMYREIFTQYNLDGLFIDGSPWPRWLPDPLCYCEWCEARYRKDTSEEFGKGLDDPQGYRKRLEWLQNASAEYLDEIYQIVHKLRPGLPIWLNQGDPFDMSTNVLRKTSCLYIEPLSTPTGLSVGSMVLRGWQMPGPQVGIFWAGYTDAPMEVDQFRTAAVMLQGTRPRFITDEQNMPDGRQRPQFFEWAGSLQGNVEKAEQFLKNLEPITSLGIVFSEATRDHLRAERKFTASFGGGDFIPSILGCAEILTRAQYPVEIVPSWGLQADSLSRFDLIALPETDALSDIDGQALRNYVHDGGKILATWKPGLVDEKGSKRADFLLGDVLGVNYLAEETKYAEKDGPGIYLQTNGHPLSSFIGAGEVGIQGKGGSPQTFCSFVRVNGPAESILDYRLPYLVPDLDKHLFHSWNPAPPGNEKVPKAATINHYGQGEAIYIGLPLFRRYQPELYWVSEWIRGMISRLVPSPSIRVQGSDAIHAAFFRQGPQRLVVQLANSSVWTSRGVAAPAQNLEIVGRNDRFRVRSARLLWPEEGVLKVVKGDDWRVHVPEVKLHAIVAIELD
jgi:hypothetical protein